MFYYDGSQFDIGVAALLLKRTVWGEVLCMNWRLGVMVVLKNDEHERIKSRWHCLLGALRCRSEYICLGAFGGFWVANNWSRGGYD